MTIEVFPGIYQLPLPIPDNPLGFTNLYLVRGADDSLLIDAGWNSEEAFQSLKNQLAEIGMDFKSISRVLVTHAHADHYGLAGRVKQYSGAKIILHYRDRDYLASRNDVGKLIEQLRAWLHINGVPDNELPRPQRGVSSAQMPAGLPPPDITLRGGEIISAGSFILQTFWTPGHSPGHLCLYEPDQKILFAGDHVLPAITPNISLRPQSSINPLGDFLKSLDVLKLLDVSLILPAHEHIFTDLLARIEEIIQHHKQRSSQILETLKTEPKTAYQVSAEITWMPELGGVSFYDLAPGDKRMAVLETMAHLEAMKADAALGKFTRDHVIYYRRN